MGFLGSLFGANTDINQYGTSAAQQQANQTALNQANQQVQSALGQTNALASMYNPAQALANQQTGFNATQNVLNQQQGLSNQLQNIAAGKGPNPAAAALANATGANVANQAALMAGQRGAGANAGLLARQIAQQGAATQQQAAGQGALMQAQQSLGALGQLGSQQANMGNIAGQLANIGGQQAGAQAQAQGVRQAGQQLANQLTMGNQAQQQQQQQYGRGLNAGIAQQNAQNNANIFGGLLGAAGAALGMYNGGEVSADSTGKGPRSSFGQALSGMKAGPVATPFAKGGAVPAMLSEGERYLNPREVAKVATGKKEAAKAGVEVKAKHSGQKAVKKGDSLKNDKIPATLEEGGIVLPRSVMESRNPHWEAHKFVSAIMKEKGLTTRKPKAE